MASKEFFTKLSASAIGAAIVTGESHDSTIVTAAFTLAADALARAGREMNAGEWDGNAERKDKVVNLAKHDARMQTILSGVAIFRDTQSTLNNVMHGLNSPEAKVKGVQMYLAGCKGLKTIGRFDQAETIARNIYNWVILNDADKAKEIATIGEDKDDESFLPYFRETFGTTFAAVRAASDPRKPAAKKPTLRERMESLFSKEMDVTKFDLAIAYLTERKAYVERTIAEAARAAEEEAIKVEMARAEQAAEDAKIAEIAAAAKAEQEAASKAA